MRAIVRHLPNALTCGNLLCGCIGIIQVFQNQLVTASYLMLLAALLDFLDGFAARLLGVASPIGKELDSLADCVTFGALPSLIVFTLLGQQAPQPTWLPYLALSLAIFSALRLAKFNIDTRQSESFIGVPTPANGLLVASLPLIQTYQPAYAPLFESVPVLLGYSALMSYLLVAELPLFALKFKHFGWQGNQIKYIFLGLSVLLLGLWQVAAIPLIIGLYVGLSGIYFWQNR
jgi:CDP-diacylglycerol---serine O-phosphatidyltransferase